MKREYITILLLSLCTMLQAQVYGTSAQMMYLQSLRELEMYSRELRPIIYEYRKEAENKYDKGDYKGCIKTVDEFFDKYKVYKGQGGIASPLYTIAGKAYYKLSYTSTAYKMLQIADADGDTEAHNFIIGIYWNFVEMANSKCKTGDYYACLDYIDKALETGQIDPNIFILQGDAYLFLSNFDKAMDSYKLAKKNGSTLAKEKIKNLKVHKKEIKKRKN